MAFSKSFYFFNFSNSDTRPQMDRLDESGYFNRLIFPTRFFVTPPISFSKPDKGTIGTSAKKSTCLVSTLSTATAEAKRSANKRHFSQTQQTHETTILAIGSMHGRENHIDI